MTHETHLDGNAVGGLLYEVFGQEMTDRRGCCDACGVVGPLGSALVFRDAPGDVVRCANCESVLMAVVNLPTGLRVTIRSLRWIELA